MPFDDGCREPITSQNNYLKSTVKETKNNPVLDRPQTSTKMGPVFALALTIGIASQGCVLDPGGGTHGPLVAPIGQMSADMIASPQAGKNPKKMNNSVQAQVTGAMILSKDRGNRRLHSISPSLGARYFRHFGKRVRWDVGAVAGWDRDMGTSFGLVLRPRVQINPRLVVAPHLSLGFLWGEAGISMAYRVGKKAWLHGSGGYRFNGDYHGMIISSLGMYHPVNERFGFQYSVGLNASPWYMAKDFDAQADEHGMPPFRHTPFLFPHLSISPVIRF